MEQLKNQQCPVCKAKKLTLNEDTQDIPYFGKVYLFSMYCENCQYKKADIESAEVKKPIMLTFTIEKSEDLKVRVVKSGDATVKIPQLKMEVKPGLNSEGYISNIEGLLNRFKEIIQAERDNAEDDVKKHAKNLLKKLWKVECGDIPLKIMIEDPSGNSAIISKKTVARELKIR